MRILFESPYFPLLLLLLKVFIYVFIVDTIAIFTESLLSNFARFKSGLKSMFDRLFD